MTDPQTPATEAGHGVSVRETMVWRDGYEAGFHAALDKAAIEAEARADDTCPDCGLTARHIGQIHITAQRAVGPGHADHIAAIRADERERLAGLEKAVTTLLEEINVVIGQDEDPDWLKPYAAKVRALLQPDTASAENVDATSK